MEFRAILIVMTWLLYRVEEVYANVRGVAGIDYPNYTAIPKTSFQCSEQKKIPGFYADLETDCQVFHHCYKHRRESYLCAPGSIFNQDLQTCDYWYSATCKPQSSAIAEENQEYKDAPLIPVEKKSSPFTVYEKMAALYEPHDESNGNFKQQLHFYDDFQGTSMLSSEKKISESELYSFTGMDTNKVPFQNFNERRMLINSNIVDDIHGIDVSSDQSPGEFQNDNFEASRNYNNNDTSKEHTSSEVLDKHISLIHSNPNAKDLSGQQSPGVENMVKKRKIRRKPTYVILQTETDEKDLNENLNAVSENKENSKIVYEPNYKHDKIQDTNSSKIVTDVMHIKNAPKRTRKPITTLSTENTIVENTSASDVKASVILDNIMTASLDDASSVTDNVNHKRRRPVLVHNVSDQESDLVVETIAYTTEESAHSEFNVGGYSEDEVNFLIELLEKFDGIGSSEIEDSTQTEIDESKENNKTIKSQLNFEFENENQTVTEQSNYDSDLNTNMEINKSIDFVSDKNLGSSFVNLEEKSSSVDKFLSGELENSSFKHDLFIKTFDEGQLNSQTDFDNPDANSTDLNLTSFDQNGVTSQSLEETGIMQENHSENFTDDHWISNSGNEPSDYDNTEINIMNNESNVSFVDSEGPHGSNLQSINNDWPNQDTYTTTRYGKDKMVEENKEFTIKSYEPETADEILDGVSDGNEFDTETQEFTTIIYEYDLSNEVRHMADFEDENQKFATRVINDSDSAVEISNESAAVANGNDIYPETLENGNLSDIRSSSHADEMLSVAGHESKNSEANEPNVDAQDFSYESFDESDFDANQEYTTIIYEYDLSEDVLDEIRHTGDFKEENQKLATTITYDSDLAADISDESVTVFNDIHPEILENSDLSDIQSRYRVDEMLKAANSAAQETNMDAQDLNYRNFNPIFSFMNEEEAIEENFKNLISNFNTNIPFTQLDKGILKEKFAKEIEPDTFVPVSPISTVAEPKRRHALIQAVLKSSDKFEDENLKESSIKSEDANTNINFLSAGKSLDFPNLPQNAQNSFAVSERNQNIKGDKIDQNEPFIEESGIAETRTSDSSSNEIDSAIVQTSNFDVKTEDVSFQTNISNTQALQSNSVARNPNFFQESDIPQNFVFSPNSMALPTNTYERHLYLQNLNRIQKKPNILLKNKHIFPTTFYRELSPGFTTTNAIQSSQRNTPKPNLASLKAGFLKLKKNYMQAHMLSPESSGESGFMASLKPLHTAAKGWFKNLAYIFPSFSDDNAFQARSGKIAKKPKKFKVPKIIKLINFGKRLLRMKQAKINMIKKFIGF